MSSPRLAAIFSAYVAQAALARGDLTAARRWADDAVAAATGWHLSLALATRARVAIAQGEPGQAERHAHEALAIAASTGAYLGAPDGIVKLFGNGCGAVDVSGLGDERWWLTASFKPLRR